MKHFRFFRNILKFSENDIKIYQTTNSLYSKTDMKLIKNKKFTEKMRNSGNCSYDYAHSFFVQNF